MKFSILNSFIVVFAYVFASFTLSDEFIYSSIEGKCSITFPEAYKSVSKITEKHSTIKTQASLEDQLYYFSHSVHKLNIEEHESYATTSLESFNETLGGSITNRELWSIHEHSGIQADIEIASKDLKVAYRAILIGQIQYQIIVISESAKWNQENADKFIASFKVED